VGYSCTVKASLVLDAIGAMLRKAAGSESSNAMPGGGFWERSNVEHADGAITGSVFKQVHVYTEAERAAAAVRAGCPDHPEWVGNPCVKAGRFRISADGKVVRFPRLTKAQRAAAEATGAKAFAERYASFA
jgi:hypothetical protein